MTGKRKASTDSSKVHLSAHDYKVLVDWIEVEANFKAIYGTDKKPKVGGPPKQTKSSAFEDMADYLFANSKHRELTRLKGHLLQSRWRTYMKKFRETLDASLHRTGFGLTERDLANGIKTVEEKLEMKCPEFSRMKAIFGDHPNISPAATIELGLPAEFVNAAAGGDANYTNDDISSDASTDYGDGLRDETEWLTPAQGQHEIASAIQDKSPADPATEGENLSEIAELSSTVITTEGDKEPLPSLGVSVGPPPTHETDEDAAANTDIISASSTFDAAQSDPAVASDSASSQRVHQVHRLGDNLTRGLAERVFSVSSGAESDGDELPANSIANNKVGKAASSGSSVLKSARNQDVAASTNHRQSGSKRSGSKRTAEASAKSGKKIGGKKTRLSNHQKSLSLAESHMEVSLKKQEMQQDYLYDQLAFIKLKWSDEKAEKHNQLVLERERHQEEAAARKTSARRDFILALVNQGKSAAEIKELLELDYT